MFQPIDLISCKMTEIIEQNFSIVQLFIQVLIFFFLARSIFSTDNVTHIKSRNPI